jgi:tRNA threonylcarbamoyladenosine biosynthesis protein TsaB
MNIVAFDTATDVCSVALRTANGTWHDHRAEPRQQARLLLPMIDALVIEAGISMADLDVVVYGRGPGSFTGVRIAVAAAQGISLATGARTLGVSTLASVAQVAYEKSGATAIVASLDARMGEVYLGHYVMDESLGVVELRGAESVVAPAELGNAEHGALFAGSGAERYADRVAGRIERDVWPTALSLLRLAEPVINAGNLDAPGEAEPVYLRDKVALTEKERGVG